MPNICKEVPTDESGKFFWWQGAVNQKWTGARFAPFQPFEETLFLDTYSKGNSSFKAVWRDQQDRRYGMFTVDFINLLKETGYDPTSGIRGEWGICKRGQNYGIFLLSELQT